MRDLAMALPVALTLVAIHAQAASVTAREETMDCGNP